MKQAIMIPELPEWYVKVLNGEKTVEMRKIYVKEGTKVYMCCTKKGNKLYYLFENYKCDNLKPDFCNAQNGLVLASFIVEKCVDMMKWFYAYKDNEFFDILKKACMTTNQLQAYAGNNTKKLYALFISKLHIFDKPKEISEFYTRNWCDACKKKNKCNETKYHFVKMCEKHLHTTPQSHCYVEELENE